MIKVTQHFQIAELNRMASRKEKRADEPAEKPYECAVGDCYATLKSRMFPSHYKRVHKMQTGRYRCSSCDFMCSYQASCILQHISKKHKDEEAVATFNPFINEESPRVKDKHTDDCAQDKLKVKVLKPTRKVSQKGQKVKTDIVLLNMNSKKETASMRGKMNMQAPGGSKAGKRKFNEDQSVLLTETNKRRKSEETVSSSR